MRISNISVPEIYKESHDFRIFLKWFEHALSQLRYDTENIPDLYDPQRCKSNLLWMLADTIGFKYDDRLPTSFNRLVLLYFMSMIRNKGSKNGITLAAEVNLAQFNLIEYGKEKDILYDRLEDTSIPVNSVYVTPHVEDGYIDVVYFSAEKPIDACIEYVRPLGMYCFQHAGVRVDSRTKISVDARLMDTRDMRISIGPTHVGHYSREDYARLQKTRADVSTYHYNNNDVEHDGEFTSTTLDASHSRRGVYYRNKDYEQEPNNSLSPGYRRLYSLQLCNNTHIMKSLIPEKDAEITGDDTTPMQEREQIFSLGYGPQDVSVFYPDDYLKNEDNPMYNLRYDKQTDESIKADLHTVDEDRTTDTLNPRPAVNKPMFKIGGGISLNSKNTVYSKVDENDEITRDDS